MQARKLTRRDFLKFGGALAVTSTLHFVYQGKKTRSLNLLRGQQLYKTRVITPEAQTSLSSVSMAILALSRLTFGIRPRDVDSFNALGATTMNVSLPL